ncbi:hypothetical protein HOO54_01230 [Bacillus sp. WMMC1349]|uniref:hypothetical protein n=1 Tax=Bacillus sp. WMMC1349 TaxID=2736254 RepID=UPI001551A5F1|nr:hypothetical protein [Bacillus sp. WMMC1349]NPC90842.1 hypothetical protein [Bacillus sp. WMMC1349]NPC90864.1 hypothetical protein [Bacillus sp. WMMC1349]NPC90898.1 hypothetical protein [Bacillus sp. WMMC1349]NPC90903.1 hypothetical protein [Bacillus sp. WMMC1349]NPC90927.1 hypothetical protein [Bacillus sp. WMMC1349]
MKENNYFCESQGSKGLTKKLIYSIFPWFSIIVIIIFLLEIKIPQDFYPETNFRGLRFLFSDDWITIPFNRLDKDVLVVFLNLTKLSGWILTLNIIISPIAEFSKQWHESTKRYISIILIGLNFLLSCIGSILAISGIGCLIFISFLNIPIFELFF